MPNNIYYYYENIYTKGEYYGKDNDNNTRESAR